MPTASKVGRSTFSGRARQLTASAPSSTPTPTIAPTNACVVDTGSRVTVANVTHATVPTNTARVNSGVGVVTIPVENSFVSSSAKLSDTSAPTNVVTVPHTIAVRYRVTPAPARVATVLGTSLAPFAAARPNASTRMAAVTA